MTKYEIKGKEATVAASYKNGVLVKIQVTHGKLTGSAYDVLCVWLPLKEAAMDDMRSKWPSVSYTLVTGQAPKIYSQFTREWFRFFDQLNGFSPKFTATDGRALKQIIDYLTEISADDLEALGTWQLILAQWHKLPEFYRLKPDLTFINSKMNEIITQIKSGKASPKTQAQSDADDLRQSL